MIRKITCQFSRTYNLLNNIELSNERKNNLNNESIQKKKKTRKTIKQRRKKRKEIIQTSFTDRWTENGYT